MGEFLQEVKKISVQKNCIASVVTLSLKSGEECPPEDCVDICRELEAPCGLQEIWVWSVLTVFLWIHHKGGEVQLEPQSHNRLQFTEAVKSSLA